MDQQRLEELERDRAKVAQKLEWTRAALIELRDLVVEKNKKILCYRIIAAFLLITTCFFAATSLFFVVYPETAKAVNTCLSNMISTFKTEKKDGYPSGSSILDATVQETETPVRDVTTNGYGTITSGPVEDNLQNGLKELPEQDGSRPE